jgi:hypothetical protein
MPTSLGMGTEEILVIKHLSKRGELLDCINCPAGKLSVLRAEQESDLIPFRQALHGDVSGQKFSIFINNDPFQPGESIYIGFGSWLPKDNTVLEILTNAGVASGQLESLAINFGLSDILSKKSEELSDDYLRRLELLVATYSNSKVIVLDSPFEPIPHIWKDKFADLILSDVQSRNRIMVFTRLCYRPETWVGNSIVNRVQVGSSVKKTIGYGQDASDFNKLVRELRQNVASPGGASTSSPSEVNSQPPLGSVFAEMNLKKQSNSRTGFSWAAMPLRQRYGVVALASFLVLAVGGAVVFSRTTEPVVVASNANTPTIAPVVIPSSVKSEVPTIAVVNLNVNPSAPPAEVAGKEVKAESDQEASASIDKEVDVQSEPKVEMAVVKPPAPTSLDGYSNEIKVAIVEAFNEKDIDLGVVAAAYKPTKSVVEEEDNPFKAISKLAPSKETSDSSYGSSYTSDYNSSPQVDSDFAARQEEIRRRFLEALQRANSN